MGLKWPICSGLSSGFVRKENLAEIFQTSKNKFIHPTAQYLWIQKGTSSIPAPWANSDGQRLQFSCTDSYLLF